VFNGTSETVTTSTYSDSRAEEAGRRVLEGVPADRAQADALALWREGNILIATPTIKGF
jgi:hypothetical protein